jgi:Bacterial virulence factor lipase N-terminal
MKPGKTILIISVVTFSTMLSTFGPIRTGIVLGKANAAAGDLTRVHALFDLATPDGSPFPSNRFTVADPGQNTGLRVNLPKPDCLARPSDCEDLDIINTLDGFNQLPRLSIPFDGSIDVATATSESVFLVSLGSTLSGGYAEGRIVGINRIVWDPASNTLHAESDELLGQHTRYGLIVTNKVRDSDGEPVMASEAFRHYRTDVPGEYGEALTEAILAARRFGVPEGDIVAASIFTTQSSTATLEKIRDQIKAAPPSIARFDLGPGGTRTVFSLDAISRITFNRHTQVSPTAFTPV